MIAALATAWLLGVLLVAAVLAPGSGGRRDVALILPLGLLIGLGATSTLFFLASLVSAHPFAVSGTAEAVIALATAGWLIRKRAKGAGTGQAAWTWLEALAAAVLVQAVVVATVVAVRTYHAEPYGGWDGWAIWNLHARFLLRAGPEWTGLLAAPTINWTHPDYPRLVSGAVARAWAWEGRETPAASALVSGAFALGTVGLLVAGVLRLRSRLAAIAGGLLLVGTPFFVTFAANQHADIPLAGYFLGAIVLAAVAAREASESHAAGRWWLLAGACAGMAAWTKNEGLLFVLVWTAWIAGQAERRGAWSRLVPVAAGLLVGLVPVALFKFGFAPANDLMAAPLGPRLAQLFEAGRHGLILRALARSVTGFGEWTFLPFAAMALPFLAWPARRRLAEGEGLVIGTLVLMLAGYYVTYVLSPLDLAWHLETSLVRLLLQLWPVALLAWSLTVPGEAPAPRDAGAKRRVRWPLWTAMQVGLGLVLVHVLSGQPGRGELALRSSGGATIAASPGPGWYPLEQHANDRWSWSAGRAEVNLYVDGAKPGPVAVRLRLRALGTRNVTIALGNQVLWTGEVGAQFVSVELAGLTLAPGANALRFTTDVPGVAESPEGGGRTLAFALYNFELR